jgi:replication initiation protein RepC
MLDIRPWASGDACGVMGLEKAAVAIACVLKRPNSINPPGGYLRDLARCSERREFSLGPEAVACFPPLM